MPILFKKSLIHTAGETVVRGTRGRVFATSVHEKLTEKIAGFVLKFLLVPADRALDVSSVRYNPPLPPFSLFRAKVSGKSANRL